MINNENNATTINLDKRVNLDIFDITFYKIIYQRILSLKSKNEKGGI